MSKLYKHFHSLSYLDKYAEETKYEHLLTPPGPTGGGRGGQRPWQGCCGGPQAYRGGLQAQARLGLICYLNCIQFVTGISYTSPPVYCEKYQQFLQWNLLVPILHTFYLQLSITIITKIHFVIVMFTKLYCTYENLAKIINIFMQNVVEYGFSFKTINNFFLLLRCRHKENHVTLIF